MSSPWTVRRPLILFLTAVNLVFLSVIFVLSRQVFLVHVEKRAALPVLAAVEPFELTRENGTPYSSRDLEGHPWVASFLFTRCPNQCPTLASRLGLLQRTLPPGARLVSFSVDPSYDTPSVLKSYAERFGAEPEKWVFLTGEPGTLGRVQSSLKLSVSGDPNLHSLRFILLDGEGRVRGYYDSEDSASLKNLKKDMKKLGTK